MKWKELVIGGLVAFIVGVLLLFMEYHTGLFQTTTSKRISSTLKLAIRRVSTMVKRAWRPVLIIGAIAWLETWIQGNLLIQLLHPLSSWTFWQYAFAIALVVPLALLIYILLIEPWHRAKRAEKAPDLLMGKQEVSLS